MDQQGPAAPSRTYGTSGNIVPDTDDTYCAIQGFCSITREMRVGARPDVYRA
ncbi:hypothetical protein ACWGSU_31660 [Streptomyces koyangensis]